MTNIRTSGMFPEVLDEVFDYPSEAAFEELFKLRIRTYQAFAEIEKGKGLLKPVMNLASTHGQEAVRILTQRGLEELAEAYDSIERDHFLEELIDAINYFWVLAIIEGKGNSPLDYIIGEMINDLNDHVHDWPGNSGLTTRHIGQAVVDLNPVFEKLRHRAWMVNPQNQYFDGYPEITSFLCKNLCLVMDQFKDWSEFVQFYIAKDNVLQFRIQTKY
jgi:hypothetical protein